MALFLSNCNARPCKDEEGHDMYRPVKKSNYCTKYANKPEFLHERFDVSKRLSAA